MREHNQLSAKDICNALLEYVLKRMIVCARLARKIELTIKQFLSASELRNAGTDVFDSLRLRPFSRGWNLLRRGLK